jgi:hypothetical protein
VRSVVGLGVVGALVFTVGLLVRMRCAVGRCPAPELQQVFALDALDGLPRLFTAGVFLLVAVVAARAAARSSRGGAIWWAAMAAAGVVLAITKAVSSHSTLEHDDGRDTTLAAAVVVAVVVLPLFWGVGRAWAVPAATPAMLALAAYAAAALGLDQLTVAVCGSAGSPMAVSLLVFVEESGEAVTALLLLAAVVAWRPRR